LEHGVLRVRRAYGQHGRRPVLIEDGCYHGRSPARSCARGPSCSET
jgi:hypothetical protein